MGKVGRNYKFRRPSRPVSFVLPVDVIEAIRREVGKSSDGLALQAWVMRRWDAKQDTGHKA